MAGDTTAASGFERRIDRTAGLGCARAARLESAAGEHRARRGRLAGDRGQLTAVAPASVGTAARRLAV